MKGYEEKLELILSFYKIYQKMKKMFGNDFLVHAEMLFSKDKNDELDDHTSVWGGAGPDCIIGRLVAA